MFEESYSYGTLACQSGGVGYMTASALAQKVRSLFGAKDVIAYDPSMAKKKEGGFFSRLIKNQLQEALAHEVSRTMSTLAAINRDNRLRAGSLKLRTFA